MAAIGIGSAARSFRTATAVLQGRLRKPPVSQGPSRSGATMRMRSGVGPLAASCRSRTSVPWAAAAAHAAGSCPVFQLSRVSVSSGMRLAHWNVVEVGTRRELALLREQGHEVGYGKPVRIAGQLL